MWIKQPNQPVSIRRKSAIFLVAFFLVTPLVPLKALEIVDIPYTDELIQLEEKYDSILDTTESKSPCS